MTLGLDVQSEKGDGLITVCTFKFIMRIKRSIHIKCLEKCLLCLPKLLFLIPLPTITTKAPPKPAPHRYHHRSLVIELHHQRTHWT